MKRHKRLLFLPNFLLALLLAPGIAELSLPAFAEGGGQLRMCLHSEPKTFNPLLVADDASETVRYLTGGFLLRVNRRTQSLEPQLATGWKVSPDGRRITFLLRRGILFSDGTPFSAADVAATVQQMMDPALHTPTGDSFRSGEGKVVTRVLSPAEVVIEFPYPVAGLDRLFDQVAILAANSPKKEMAVLGPFFVSDHKPGSHLVLTRNPNYWKKDAHGRALPYLDSIRLEIQPNRDLEFLQFQRGEIDLINAIDAEHFDRLAKSAPGAAHDMGPSLDTEQLWFNQRPGAPIAPHKRAWFRSQAFRVAISEAINRTDLARVVYSSHAQPAHGPVSPVNKLWFNSTLPALAYSPASALRRLQQDGFRLQNGVLHDRNGNSVEFSIVTNSGNQSRERMAAMIQQDLSAIGVKVNIATLDFPSLIERFAQTFDYEACLLGMVNVDLDPNAQMSVWLSSGDNHQWNPAQSKPEKGWEAEIDRLMRAQSSALDNKVRKTYFDRVQRIAAEQAPFLYLINKNALAAISPRISGSQPAALRPETYWNIEQLSIQSNGAERKR